jgi:hypothetical protein
MNKLNEKTAQKKPQREKVKSGSDDEKREVERTDRAKQIPYPLNPLWPTKR